jgi:hypothetical protein
MGRGADSLNDLVDLVERSGVATVIKAEDIVV